jgi:hypothetical protein
VARIAMIFGLLLILLGLGGFFGTGSAHPTALIPAGLGLALLLLGALALKDNLRKHAMHAAALVGLIGAVGGGIRLLQPLISGTEISLPVAYICTAVMAVLCLTFVVLCVNSFVQARRRRATP